MLFGLINALSSFQYFINNCYGPYIPASTSTQGGLGKIDSQYTGYRTDGTSGAIEQGVAELYN